ncbi:MAG: alpha-N-acetylglucosaminidase C-terminal domain-containing protein, partial [Chitinophagaceae bacterium]
VLATYADQLQQGIAKSYDHHDLASFQKESKQFLDLISDLDRLLATRKEFLLGRWIQDARTLGSTAEEKSQFERNAKLQITLWSDKNATLHDYACKQWSGMLSSFYKPRWEQFFDKALLSLKENKPMDLHAFDEQMKDWEWNWVITPKHYADTTTGNPVTVSEELYRKYHFLFKQ